MAPERAKRPGHSGAPATIPTKSVPAGRTHPGPLLPEASSAFPATVIGETDFFPFETGKFDPFAEGNEKFTPPETLAFRTAGLPPDGPGWRVRVVPNKFPALRPSAHFVRKSEGIYESMSGLGVHEVIIECPQLETNLARLSVENIREVLLAYRLRMLELKRDQRLVHAIIFKNNGIRAGASLPHAHSQLIASPVVPITIAEKMDAARQHYLETGDSIFAVMARQELDNGTRVVMETSHFVVICPYASRFPYETCILPKAALSHFEQIRDIELNELGDVLKTLLGKLESGLGDPPYNYVIHTAPFTEPEVEWFRWHMEIFPRMTSVAGFEWGSGFYINPVYPESAARQLRETSL